MHIPWLTDFVIFAQENGAPAPGQGAEQAPQSGFGMFVPLIGIFLIFWFLIIRPQSKQQKERNLKIKAARKGDNVVTIGGVYGKIVKETELDVVLEVDKHSKTRIQFQRTAIRMSSTAPRPRRAPSRGRNPARLNPSPKTALRR